MKVYSVDECVVCLSEACGTVVFLPCAHACACASCADEIHTRSLACPLCRVDIARTLTVDTTNTHIDVDHVEDALLQSFLKDCRKEYMEQLKRPLASNAGMKGKGKFARSVNAHVGSELEARIAETKGAERMSVGKKVEFSRSDTECRVMYKVGRKVVEETFEFMTHETLTRTVKEFVGEARITALELATHHPNLYWLVHHHASGDIEGELQSLDCLMRKRARR